MLSTEPVRAHVTPSTGDYAAGVYEIKGLARLETLPDEPPTLVFEYRVNTTAGIAVTVGTPAPQTSTNAVVIRIPLSDLRAAEFKRSMFGARLTLFARTLTAFDGLRGASGDSLALLFKRADRDDASHLATALQLALTERRLDVLR